MPHIHTNAGDHDHSVSFFIIRTDLGEPRVMLHMHKKVGKLMMFGGHVELQEHPWAAALHEITEETGFAHDQLRILQPARRQLRLTGAVVHPMPVSHATQIYPGDVPHFHTNISYAMTAAHAPIGTPDAGESTDIRLLTRSELIALPAELVEESFRELALEILDYYLYEWSPMSLFDFAIEPGATVSTTSVTAEPIREARAPLPKPASEARAKVVGIIRDRCDELGLEQPTYKIDGELHELVWTVHSTVPTLSVQSSGSIAVWETFPTAASRYVRLDELDAFLTSELCAPARLAA